MVHEILSLIIVPFALSFGLACAMFLMRRGNAKRIMGCAYMPTKPDAADSAKRIGVMLRKRADVVCFDVWYEKTKDNGIEDMSSIFYGGNYGMVSFIRLCHFVGCEVVVRPVADPDADIEDDPDGSKEVISKIKKEYYA